MPWDLDRLTVLDYVQAVDTIEKRIDAAEKAQSERARARG